MEHEKWFQEYYEKYPNKRIVVVYPDSKTDEWELYGVCDTMDQSAELMAQAHKEGNREVGIFPLIKEEDDIGFIFHITSQGK
ncbi:MAG: hypothetical protein FWG65_10805 [Turicibacter sp.]|nr:hypothetical protein [Turicibacter sp.]